ncbi:Ig-like domain-containing protein [Priestia aryabhattai]|uniref:Ig-like domain-containing protein n=1 Tax=Priestia aryabhattai TaxID=412384 RepID=A0AAX6NJE1_PRIAR|nr:Ig-like domain-containing protein [Priestia aryabhattai]MDU9695780.1 Ig-like domain-containing protein [Priestia aryabhattai]
MKKTILGLVSVIGVLGVFLYPNGSIAKETSLDKVDFKQINVESDKKWTLQFTDGVVENNLTKDNVYVRDEKKQSIPVSFAKVDSKTVEVNAPEKGYDKSHTYTLYINKNLDKTSSLYKEDTKSKEYSIQFTVK